jgi:hypothetical protein
LPKRNAAAAAVVEKRLLKNAAEAANTSTMVGEDELKWKTSTGIRILVRHLAAALRRELAHGLARFRGRYDVAIATPERLVPARQLLTIGRGQVQLEQRRAPGSRSRI